MSWTSEKYFNIQHGIGRKLMIYIFLFSSAITFIATSLQLALDYFRDVRLIEDRVHQIEISYLQSLINSLWLSDMDQLKLQLEGISRLPDMQYLEIKQGEKSLILIGEYQTAHIILHQFPLAYDFNNRKYDIGVLHVAASLEGVYQRLIDKLFVILVTQTVKTFLVSMFILFLFYKLVGIHLISMGNYAKSMNTESMDIPLTLKRHLKKNEEDELEQLVLSINEMRVNLRNALAELRKINEELEDRVAKRTEELAQANAELGVTNEKLREAMDALWGEMELARKLQTCLLPILSENIHSDFEIAGDMLTADEVGGDFYDISLDRTGNLWIAIGDVSGHGVTPGLIMMMAQTVHTTVTANLDCDARDVVVKVNEILYMNVHERLKETHFMTFTALKYLGDGKFQHAGAHLRMIVFRRETGTCDLIRTRGVYLNFKKDISKATENSEFGLSPGDVLVLYTDGLTEAHDPDGNMLDLDGFVKIVESHAHQEPEAMKDAIMTDVINWCGNIRADDMTLVIVRRVDSHLNI